MKQKILTKKILYNFIIKKMHIHTIQYVDFGDMSVEGCVQWVVITLLFQVNFECDLISQKSKS